MPEITLPATGRCQCGALTFEITAPPFAPPEEEATEEYHGILQNHAYHERKQERVFGRPAFKEANLLKHVKLNRSASL